MLPLTLALVLSQAPTLAAPPWTAVEVSSEKAQFFSMHVASALRGYFADKAGLGSVGGLP